MKATLLLVEDSKLLRVANARVLTKAGYNVISAEDGEKALGLAQECLPDLILLDMLLPKLGGPQVLEALKKKSHYRTYSNYRFEQPFSIERTKAEERWRCGVLREVEAGVGP